MKKFNDLITDDYLKDMLVRMTHHTTALEGNTLTLAETTSILINNYIPREMSEKDYDEVKNYKKVLPLLLEKGEISPELIKEYNRLIMNNIRDDAGQYKKINNIIIGADFETTKAYQVPYVMKEWCDNFNFRMNNAKTSEEKINIILDEHIKFEKIHPFGDGNGRTGRVLIIHSCFKENLIPIIIPKNEKDKYINYLAKEDTLSFTKWAISLQEKERERLEIFFDNNIKTRSKKTRNKELSR